MPSPFLPNKAALNQPQVEDWNSFRDFRDGLADNAPKIEALIAQLRSQPNQMPVVADLFRAFHNIKGDAGLCRLEFVLPLIHAVESLLTRMRAGELLFTDLLGEVFLLTLDRLEQAIDLLERHEPASGLALLTLCDGLEGLALFEQAQIDQAAARLIEAITGFRPGNSHLPAREAALQARSKLEQDDDLRYFRELALQLEARSNAFQGRTDRNLTLALATNREVGNRVDPQQLEAAVYLHDLGMMFLPEHLWLKSAQLDAAEREQLKRHPSWGAEWCNRIPGWQAAAEMILQHHEQANGSGYPYGLKAEQICDGAKILAIIDAFDAILLRHSHRGQQKSLLRAIAEINAGDRQFASDWIQAFNRVIRRHLEGQQDT
ncbi:HD domain-containing phosphohydrolase [Chitinibacter tainanensis]|uniref:HD domain-containing phosphohydrolase n=1 Tax=Chitinibacter tainanensis TaxID=230667 RepID=UPI0023549734|nr:HD domain-containing phosphohydrolase [Chitinibacter tainanensis]